MQVSSLQQLNQLAGSISDVLDRFHVRGLSLRVPWDALDPTILERASQLAHDAGAGLSIRVMAGRFTPAAVFDAGSPSYVVDGDRIPTPFFPDGSPNTVFEAAYTDLVTFLASYCRAHDVHLLHLPWYGQEWAELNNGAEVRSQPGYSPAAILEAHERLLDIAIPFAGDGLAIEYPMSGYGPLPALSQALTAHIVDTVGARSRLVYVQANGLDQNGDWGAPSAGTEAAMDAAVFAQPVARGEQMIQPGDFPWDRVYAGLEANGADYVEIYLPSFYGDGASQLAAQIDAFNTALGVPP